jgi:hypothetical protein
MLSRIAAFGIWPALPLTGYWLLIRSRPPTLTQQFPPISSFGLISVAGIALWSIPMLGSAIAGIYRADVFGVLGWAITLSSLRGLFERREFAPHNGSGWTRWDGVLSVGLVVAAVIYLGFPQESIYGGTDEGIYANHGVYIAHHGRTDVLYPWREPSEAILRGAFKGYAGLYPTRPTMTVQFGHLVPVWLAQAFSTFGHHGLFRLNGIFALLFLGIFYGVCRRAMPESYASVATLFLGLNVSQIWAARITLSEILAQLFIWAALLLILEALQTNDSAMMRWSGMFLGLSALARIDSFFLVPLLFLSHLGHRIAGGPEGIRTSPIWYRLYQTALPTFLLALGCYYFFSAPYFWWTSGQLKFTGVAAAIVLIALFTSSSRVLRIVHPCLTGRTAIFLVGLALIVLTVYGYWIRPTRMPYSLITSPWRPLQGTRDFREDSLVNLARYLSPPVVFMGILGWFVSLRSMLQRSRGSQLAAALVVVAGFSVVYLWNPHVAPLHFWAIRRFVPVIIPGFVLFAFAGGWTMLRRLPTRWVSPAAQAIVIFLSVLTVKVDALILPFAENKGYFNQLRDLSKKLPDRALILAIGGAEWVDPLYLTFDRRVVPVDVGTEAGRSTLKSWVEHQLEKHQGAYLLYEGNFTVPGLQKLRIGETALSRSYSEHTPHPLPKKILHDQRNIVLYRIIGVSERSDYRNMNLGARMVWGVEESGFHGQEWHGGIPRRWTSGDARLVVPVDARRPLKALRVDLASTGPGGTDLRILVNGQQLFAGNSPAGSWSRLLGLSAPPLGDRATVELRSGTFRPKDTIPGSVDARKLGVLVQSVRLLENQKPISGGPLSANGYRSQLTMAKETDRLTMAQGQMTPLSVVVRNVGDDPWPINADLGHEKGSVSLGILWFAKGQPGKRMAEQRAKLPYTMFHEDEVEVEVNLDPVGYDGNRLPPGHYEVWIGLVQEQVAWFYDKGDAVLKLPVDVKP